MTQLAESSNIISEIIRTITELRNGSGYGSVEITLHDGRVTLIEKREKVRFNKDDKETLRYKTSAALNAQRTEETKN
jgi:hypothetical protein